MLSEEEELQRVKTRISDSKKFWQKRNKKFQSWYETLLMIDTLASKGLESYVSNEPATFYDMSHFLLTRGSISHSIGIERESAIELDRKAKVDRACRYMWDKIDRERRLGGSMSFTDELAFYLLVLGWRSVVFLFDKDTGFLHAQLWNPYDTYPTYANNRMIACVHSYSIEESEAKIKADENGWNYQSRGITSGKIILDDYFEVRDGIPYNIVLFDSKPVTSWVERPEMLLLVAPVAGYPDKGSLTSKKMDWRSLSGRGIFEVNDQVNLAFNKWKTMVSQALRDTVQPVTQEFSATPQATPEQLMERGALFHYAPGEEGLQRLPPGVIPIEVQSHLLEIRREIMKGSFNDAVWGMVEKEAGYALGLMAEASANQILYPYMDDKHLVLSEGDRFWLSQLKSTKRTFDIKGKFVEKLKPTDIPEDVSITVSSDVATPKDWLERGTIANQLKEHLDKATLLHDVLHQSDPQAIIRHKSLDDMLDHPMSRMLKMIAGYQTYADYLDTVGDRKQAVLFRKGAKLLEAQLGAPEPGQGRPEQATRVAAEREAGTPEEKTKVASKVQPPEGRGGEFTPSRLRQLVGRGKIRAR